MSNVKIDMEIIKIKMLAEEVKNRSEVILQHIEDLYKLLENKTPTSILKFQVGDYLLFDHLIQHGPQIVSQISTVMGVAYDLIGIKSGNRYYNAVKTLEELNEKINQSIGDGANVRKISREELKNLL